MNTASVTELSFKSSWCDLKVLNNELNLFSLHSVLKILIRICEFVYNIKTSNKLLNE